MDKNTRFIVIDDDALNNKICRACIEKLFKDAHVTTFTDPLIGFDHVAAEYALPDVEHEAILFLDINMPVMNGWDMLKKLKEDDWGKQSKVIMLTTTEDTEAIARAVESGSLAYLIKTDESPDGIVA